MNILLIGGSKGIGQAIREKLVSQDHIVTTMNRPYMDLTLSTEEISNRIKQCMKIKNHYLPIDALIVSAGQGAFMNPIVSDETAETLFRTNTIGPIACYWGALKGLLKAQGKVIFITSTVARKPGSGGLSLYAATKGALHSFVISEGRRAAKHGIGICAVAPGYIDSPMTESLIPQVRNSVVKGIPYGRMGLPGEVADFVSNLIHQSNWCLAGSIYELSGGA